MFGEMVHCESVEKVRSRGLFCHVGFQKRVADDTH